MLKAFEQTSKAGPRFRRTFVLLELDIFPGRCYVFWEKKKTTFIRNAPQTNLINKGKKS